MPLDPSISLGIQQPQPYNPLAAVGQFAGVANALQQNKLLGAETANMQAQTPGIQAQSAAQQQDLAVARSRRAAQVGYSLMTLPDSELTPEKVSQTIDQEVAAGTIDPNTAAIYKSNIQPDEAAPPLREMVTHFMVANLAGPEAVKLVAGEPVTLSNGNKVFSGFQRGILNPAGPGGMQASTAMQMQPTPGEALPGMATINTGGSTQIFTRDPITGALTPTAGVSSIPNTPSPDSQNDLVKIYDPATQSYRYVPRNQVPGAPMVNGAGQPAPGAPIAGLPSSGAYPTPTNKPAPIGDGRNPMGVGGGGGGTANPGSASNPAPQAVPTLPPTAGTPGVPTPASPAGVGVQAEPALGTADEIKASVDHASAARAAANNYQATVYPLKSAYAALQGADTGKGTAALNSVRSILQNVTPTTLQRFLPPTLSDPQRVASYDEAQKYLMGMAMGQPGASGSDLRASQGAAATPSTHISPIAAQAVVRAALGQARMQQAGTLAFNATGQPAAAYDRFMANWNTAQDPRAFIADMQTPQERSATVAAMGGPTSPAFTRYLQSYKAAKAAGLLGFGAGG